MTTSPQPEATLERTLATIVAEARAQVAAGREPNTSGLAARVATAARLARSQGADDAAVDRAEANARRALETIASVHRSRALVAREAAPPKPAVTPPRRPTALRTKPTITGTLDVRRAEGEGFRLVWDAVPAVAEWEVRISERADVRSDYVECETLLMAAGETSVELALADTTLRVNILGRGRGRLQRRALISGLTKEGWRDRWQRRASAS